MRHRLAFIFLLCGYAAAGQVDTTTEKGQVSYVSSQHIYVKFESTEGIEIGDTLFFKKDDRLVPGLLVNNKSSISCVCTGLGSEKLKIADEVFTRKIVREDIKEVEQPSSEPPEEAPPVKPEAIAGEAKRPAAPEEEEEEEEDVKQRIIGRISAAAYSNLSDSRTSHQMRYTLSMQAQHIGNSRFSANSYITFRHTLNEWEKVRNNLSQALKVYSLSVDYALRKSSSLSLGRKMNPYISSIGAIDGVQFERGAGNFLLGAIAGTRPDYMNYGLNLHLFQTGLYISHLSTNKNQYQQNTLAFLEQRNHGKTDRRFVYFQHSSTLGKNLNAFSSFEVDLYENLHGRPRNTMSLTNLYLSLRYRISRKMSITTAYDNRKNIIYYESFKNYLDSLIENETRQGLRVTANYRPFKYVTWGISASWRFQKSNRNVSRNLNSYLNISRLPGINASASLTANFLQTNYLDSKAFGVRIFKDLIPGKLDGDIYYRMVDYRYKIYEYNVLQHIAGINFSVRLTRKLGVYLYYEGTFDDRAKTYHRINTKIVQRF